MEEELYRLMVKVIDLHFVGVSSYFGSSLCKNTRLYYDKYLSLIMTAFQNVHKWVWLVWVKTALKKFACFVVEENIILGGYKLERLEYAAANKWMGLKRNLWLLSFPLLLSGCHEGLLLRLYLLVCDRPHHSDKLCNVFRVY